MAKKKGCPLSCNSTLTHLHLVKYFRPLIRLSVGKIYQYGNFLGFQGPLEYGRRIAILTSCCAQALANPVDMQNELF